MEHFFFGHTKTDCIREEEDTARAQCHLSIFGAVPCRRARRFGRLRRSIESVSDWCARRTSGVVQPWAWRRPALGLTHPKTSRVGGAVGTNHVWGARVGSGRVGGARSARPSGPELLHTRRYTVGWGSSHCKCCANQRAAGCAPTSEETEVEGGGSASHRYPHQQPAAYRSGPSIRSHHTVIRSHSQWSSTVQLRKAPFGIQCNTGRNIQDVRESQAERAGLRSGDLIIGNQGQACWYGHSLNGGRDPRGGPTLPPSGRRLHEHGHIGAECCGSLVWLGLDAGVLEGDVHPALSSSATPLCQNLVDIHNLPVGC